MLTGKRNLVVSFCLINDNRFNFSIISACKSIFKQIHSIFDYELVAYGYLPIP